MQFVPKPNCGATFFLHQGKADSASNGACLAKLHWRVRQWHTASNPTFASATPPLAAWGLAGDALKAADREAKDIVSTAVSAGSFKTLAAALGAGGLVETLQGQGPFTVFAPTDAAFAKLPAGTVENLLKPENKAQLIAILTYHVVPGKVMAADVVKLKEAKTVNGKMLQVKVNGSNVMINDANVTATDIAASNGVIHVIDSVVLPQAA